MRKIAGFMLRGTLLLAAFWCLVAWGGAARAQTVLQSFDGDKGIDKADCKPETTRCGRQPEMNVAVNGKEVIQVTWQDFRLYDYKGKLLKSTPMEDFVKNAGLDPMAEGRAATDVKKGPFEPHAIYDEFIDRWIVTATCSNDCLMVSATPDPNGAWGGVYLTCLQGGPCLNHDPAIHIGYDKNGLYYCGGHIGDDNPSTIKGVSFDCFAVPTAEIKPIAHGTPPEHINRMHNMPLDIIPAIDHDKHKAANAPAFFADKSCARTPQNACQQSSNFQFEWVVNTFTWKGATGEYNAGGSQQLVKTDIGSQQDRWLYNSPCCGKLLSIPQAGSEVTLRSAESHRIVNLEEYGNHLYAVLGSGPCTQDCGAQGTDTNNLMIYVDLDCSKPTACVVSQTTKITGAGISPLYGTVGVDKNGNVGIAAMTASATTDLSILLWSRLKTDPPNTFRGPTTVVTGTQPYTCLNNNNMSLIGNAVGILTARDPKDGTKLWTTLQWSNDATACVWNTRIIEYQAGKGK